MPRITVLKVSVSKPEGKNYEVCELGYKTDEGKVKAMKILSFASPDVFKIAKQVSSGDILDATFSQSEKGFWQFQSLTPTGVKEATDKGNSNVVPNTAGTRGNWETPAERAARQVMIIRQSSLSNAVAFYASREPKGVTADAKSIVELAKFFESYVLDEPEVTGEVE